MKNSPLNLWRLDVDLGGHFGYMYIDDICLLYSLMKIFKDL
jgi:hypothetical protein